MKSRIFILALFLVTGTIIGFYPLLEKAHANPNLRATDSIDIKTALHQQRPKIQLAILLDTSGSMNGLIDQARNQLWQVVNEFSESTQNGVKPLLEVAVYEYGNSGLSSETGYTRQVTGLTEYCGYAIDAAVSDLDWSTSDRDIKAIFIAGNEPFTQGPVPFKQAMASARNRDITVNTIHAGPYDQGVSSGWQQGALLAGGDYMSIDHNHQVAHIVAPQDKKIAELNAKLNQTYIPFGSEGKTKAQRQQDQDSKSSGISLGLLAKRVKSKVSAMYQNSSWDLVDALEEGKVDLEELDQAELPASMRAMDAAGKKDYVADKARERAEIAALIKEETESRDDYVAAAKAAAPAPEVATMNDALSSAIRKQGEKKNYLFQ